MRGSISGFASFTGTRVLHVMILLCPTVAHRGNVTFPIVSIVFVERQSYDAVDAGIC